ncbi:hypothetical protein FKM82_020291 [Ascaphus truei]
MEKYCKKTDVHLVLTQVNSSFKVPLEDKIILGFDQESPWDSELSSLQQLGRRDCLFQNASLSFSLIQTSFWSRYILYALNAEKSLFPIFPMQPSRCIIHPVNVVTLTQCELAIIN